MNSEDADKAEKAAQKAAEKADKKAAKKAAKKTDLADDHAHDDKYGNAKKKRKLDYDTDDTDNIFNKEDRATRRIVTRRSVAAPSHPKEWTYYLGWGLHCFHYEGNGQSWPDDYGNYWCWKCHCYHQWAF